MFKKIIFFLLLVPLIIYFPGCGSTLKYTVDGTIKYKSFLYLTKILTIKKCGADSCEKPINLRSSASGYIVKIVREGAYIMTAAHVCDDSADSMRVAGPKKISSKYFVYNSVGKKYRATVLAYDNKIDACMLYVQNLTENVEAVVISSIAPVPGDKVFNVAAPYGIWKPGITPLLEGRYNGEDDNVAAYTLSAAPGSSGSMILNERGELIGMLHSVFVRFPHISLSVRYYDLKNFINHNLHKYMLYKNVMQLLNLKDIFAPYP